MALLPYNRVSDVIDERIRTQFLDEAMHLMVPAEDGPVRLSPSEARDILYGRPQDRSLGEAVWQQAVLSAQRETDVAGPYRLLLLWLALPRMYRTSHRASTRLFVDRRDLESEVMLALLEGVDTANPEQPDIGDELVGQACRRMWSFARSAARETLVADVSGVAAARNACRPDEDEEDLHAEGSWDLHIIPPGSSEGLSAPLRFTESSTRTEDERLGSPTGRLGLWDIAYRARRPAKGKRIGTLSLRPAAARR
ncbi:hypothetical protein OK074_5327 [Actinobacteria bacterium OK074]|nr:hypothetical protein OK074_5327 [Actinobacteria bacterium OK074]